MAIRAKTHWIRLTAPLPGLSLMASLALTSLALAEGPTKGADFVRVVPDQMHQLQVVKVETRPFRTQRSAIGQIGYNEDASTVVLTPFSFFSITPLKCCSKQQSSIEVVGYVNQEPSRPLISMNAFAKH